MHVVTMFASQRAGYVKDVINPIALNVYRGEKRISSEGSLAVRFVASALIGVVTVYRGFRSGSVPVRSWVIL